MAERSGSATVDAPVSSDAPRRPGLRGVLLRRWPTLLAVALAGPALLGPSTAEDVHDLAGVMMILPFWYVVVAAFDLRRWTWAVLVGTVVLVTLLKLQDRVEPALGVLAVGLAAAVWGALRGRLAQPSFLLQVTGLVAWAALVLAGLTLAGDVARYVVAAGWFAHGLWDLAHLRADATVARSAAEWCAVVDLLVPVALLLPLVL